MPKEWEAGMHTFGTRHVRRLWWLLLLGVILPALACNLDNGAVTISTATPAPSAGFTIPLVGVNPISGPPGTTITLMATGFSVGTQLNVFISTLNTPSSTPATVLTANAGVNVFTLPVPQQLNGVAVAAGTPLLFTVAPVAGGATATALFWVQGAVTGQITATTQVQAVATIQNGGAVTGVFITAPAIDSAVGGSSVAVTGSAPSGAVVVQVQDANNAVLGSTTANSQATTGTLGVWQATVTFTPPAGTANGFIVAIQGGQQASIPIVFSGAGAALPVLPTQTFPATLIFATPTPGIQIAPQ
ncbi:MAG: Gmad2 immunoglobulin-like domain-containing protein [Aggregatilineales bacterium]